MVTFFHVMVLLGMIAGTLAGSAAGWQWFGLPGLFIGAVVGFFIGAKLGQLPLLIALIVIQRKLAPMSNEDLRHDLRSSETVLLSYVLLELNRRGEDVSVELPYLYARPTADNGNQRAYALAAMQSVFPEYVEKIPDYRPFSTTEACRAAAKPLMLALEAEGLKPDADAVDPLSAKQRTVHDASENVRAQ